MDIKDLKKLTKHYRDAELVFKDNGRETKNFDIEFKFTSEGKWIAEITLRFPN